MRLGQFIIEEGCRPFIVAEMSGNHNQSYNRALEMVEKAAECGVHAIKFQTYTADTMTINCAEDEFLIKGDNLWQGETLYSLYEKAHTPWDWHEGLFLRARELGLIPFSSPFDESAVAFLEGLDAPFYKIASFEITDIPLITCVAATGKPVIISTGMASLSEISDAVQAVKKASPSGESPILLKCTSTYPATANDSNLATINHMREAFGCHVGLSDHTLGIGVSVASVSYGAVVIEKHFTLSRSDGGVDSAFSMEPHELKSLVIETERAWESIGRVNYGGTKSEEENKIYRRSIYVTKDVRAGDQFSTDNVRCIRPGLGLSPRFFRQILGQTAAVEIKKGTPLDWTKIDMKS